MTGGFTCGFLLVIKKYRSYLKNFKEFCLDVINFVLVPVRLSVPQPILAKIPILRTNEDERIRVVLSELKGVVIDIGCGNNLLIQRYRSKGGEGIGVDVFDWGADLIVENSDRLPFETASFDCATFVASFNHIPNRIEVLREVHRLLKPGGKLLITNLTPFISFLWHKIIYWDEDQSVRGMKEGEVWGFTGSELTAMVCNENFVLIKKRGFTWRLNHLFIFERK